MTKISDVIALSATANMTDEEIERFLLENPVQDEYEEYEKTEIQFLI